MLVIVLNNGAKIMGLPANPDTARGFSGNVILDEFAFHTDSRKIWTALYPTISRNGYKLRIVSTPQGYANKMHELWQADNKYSKHFVDIYKAIADGCPQNADELREGLDDEDSWLQEYECLFIDDSSILLTYELITGCQNVTVPDPVTLEEFNWDYDFKTTGGPLYAGLDIGRHKDLTVFTLIEMVGDVYWPRLILQMPKVEYSVQKETIIRLDKKLRFNRMCIDRTGIGDNLSEDLTKALGMYRVEGIQFTNPVCNVMATRMLQTFQDRKIRVPVARKMRDSLHKIKKVTTKSGNIRYEAERDDKGHADEFWSLALALEATDNLQDVKCVWL